MKLIRTAALLLLCLCLLPGCANDNGDSDFEMPETHAGAINPDAITNVRIVHFLEDGTADVDLSLDSSNLLVPLLATVYDKATETTLIGERVKIFEITMTGKDININLTLYSDMTMDDGSVTLTGKDMHDFIFSFLPAPDAATTVA